MPPMLLICAVLKADLARVLGVLALLALAGCASTPLPTGLAPPEPRLMAVPSAVPDIPPGDGDPAVRARYYALSRRGHGQCRDQVQGLQVYARTVAPTASPPSAAGKSRLSPPPAASSKKAPR